MSVVSSKNSYKTYLLISLLIPSLLLVASKTSAENIATWDQLVQQTKSNHPRLQSGRSNRSRTAHQSEQATESFWLPKVSAGASVGRSFETSLPVTRTTNQFSVEARQNLFSGFKDQASKNTAELKESIESEKLKLIEAQLLKDLRQTFDRLLYFKQAIKIANEAYNRLQQNVRIVSLRYDGGRENKSSLIKTEASALESKTYLDSLSTRESIEIERMRIMCQCQVDVSVLVASDKSQLADLNTSFDPNLHPEYRSLELQTKIASTELKGARGNWWPTVDAVVSATKRGQDLKVNKDTIYQGSLQLNVPIFTPGQSSSVDAAIENLVSNQVDLAHKRDLLKLDFLSAKSDFEIAKQRVLVNKKVAEASTLQAEVYRQRYTLGMVSFQDWDASEGELIRAERLSLDTDLELKLAQTNLKFARADVY